jgi:hypothetical protein
VRPKRTFLVIFWLKGRTSELNAFKKFIEESLALKSGSGHWGFWMALLTFDTFFAM